MSSVHSDILTANGVYYSDENQQLLGKLTIGGFYITFNFEDAVVSSIANSILLDESYINNPESKQLLDYLNSLKNQILFVTSLNKIMDNTELKIIVINQYYKGLPLFNFKIYDQYKRYNGNIVDKYAIPVQHEICLANQHQNISIGFVNTQDNLPICNECNIGWIYKKDKTQHNPKSEICFYCGEINYL